MTSYQHLALSDKGFLFDTTSGVTFTLNRTGVYIMKSLIEGLDAETITSGLTAVFEVETDMAKRDVEQFIMRVNEFGLPAKQVDEMDSMAG